MRKEVLMRIGLTGNESEVYLALLELGPSLASRIVKKTGINRTNVYDCFERLISKGLAAYSLRNNRKFFNAAEPERIIRYIEEKEQRLGEEKRAAEDALPELHGIMSSQSDDSIEIYEGREGLKTILEDIIREKSDVFTYGSEGNFTRILRFYFKHYLARLEKTGIKMKVIFNDDDSRKPFGFKFAEVRYVPKEFKTPTETTLYGDKVAIFILSGSPKAILIKSKEVTNSYKKYFEILWRSAKKG